MATARSVITRSLRALRVIDPREEPEAENAEDAVAILNSMVHRWRKDGIGLPFVTLNNSAETIQVPEEAIEPIVYNLAMRLATEYGTTPSAEVARLAKDGYDALLRDSTGWVHADLESMPGATGGGGYDIYNP